MTISFLSSVDIEEFRNNMVSLENTLQRAETDAEKIKDHATGILNEITNSLPPEKKRKGPLKNLRSRLFPSKQQSLQHKVNKLETAISRGKIPQTRKEAEKISRKVLHLLGSPVLQKNGQFGEEDIQKHTNQFDAETCSLENDIEQFKLKFSFSTHKEIKSSNIKTLKKELNKINDVLDKLESTETKRSRKDKIIDRIKILTKR